MNEIVLKPCPFCGGTNIRKGRSVQGHGDFAEFLQCLECGAGGPDDMTLAYKLSKDTIQEAWNKRV